MSVLCSAHSAPTAVLGRWLGGPGLGGGLFAASSDPRAGLPPFLRRGRLAFAVCAAVALVNARLASTLPPWPAARTAATAPPASRRRRSTIKNNIMYKLT